MLDTALANVRFALSMVLGRPFHLASLDHIVRAMRQTRDEFGSIGADSAELLGGPRLDDEARRVLQGRRFRAQATRAARQTTYYADLFERSRLDPSRLKYGDIGRLPITPKEALRNDPEAFVCRDRKPSKRATTTGTTGWPTSVYFSAYEFQLIASLAALAFMTRGLIESDDIVQISISTRATLGITGTSSAAGAVGATLHVAGLVSPEHTLALLTERHHFPGKKAQVSVMSTYPSYLGELVECAIALGYNPRSFGLRRVLLGGELLSDGLQRRSRQVFGDVEFVQNYGMTELAPFGGNVCSQGHLHFEPSTGLVEVMGLERASLALHNEPGVLVVTPFQPYRETTVLLRYNTEDVVRPIGGPLSCNLRNTLATTNLLGKLRLSVRHDDGWTFLRDVLEALENVDAVPLPARYGFWAVPGGIALEVVARSDTPDVQRLLHNQLEERGVPLRQLHIVTDPSRLQHPIPLRCDLKEGSFARLDRPGAPQGNRTRQPGVPVGVMRT